MVGGARCRGGVQNALGGKLRIIQSKDFTCVTGLILAALSEEKVKALASFLSHLEEEASSCGHLEEAASCWARLEVGASCWGRLCVSNCEPLVRATSPSTAVVANLNFLI